MDEHEEMNEAPRRTTVARWALTTAGILLVALGTIGAFLPVLPTTPFVLLAAACFARSSPAFHQRLLDNRIFGPYIAEWQASHTIPLTAKRRAYGLVLVSFGLSVVLVNVLWIRVLLAVTGTALFVFLARLPTSDTAPPH